MEKFNRTLRGYDPVEVNAFLDRVIRQVEDMIEESDKKDEEIKRLKSLEKENKILNEKLDQYRRTEETMQKAIYMAQKTSDAMRLNAQNEGEAIIEEARRNANRIINEALLRAEKTEYEANMLRRNINIFKRRLKSIIEAQLDMVEEIEKVEL